MLNPHLARKLRLSLCLLDCQSSVPACLLLVVTTPQGGLTPFCSTSSFNIWKLKLSGVLAWIERCVRPSVLELKNGGTGRRALATRLVPVVLWGAILPPSKHVHDIPLHDEATYWLWRGGQRFG